MKAVRSIFLLVLALAGAPTGYAEERQGGQVVMQMVSVSGALERDAAGELEIASDLGGRYRIDPHGAGDALGARARADQRYRARHRASSHNAARNGVSTE